MKKIILLLLVLALQACSSDESILLIEEELLVKEMTDTETEHRYVFFYNADSTIQKIDVYTDGYTREWVMHYMPGTKTLLQVMETFDNRYVRPITFVYNNRQQLDSVNFFDFEAPTHITSGLVYAYNANAQIVEARYWHIDSSTLNYPLTFDASGNLVRYEDDANRYEFDYSAAANPLYRLRVPLHALYFVSAPWRPFTETLSKNRARAITYNNDGHTSSKKIDIDRNQFNYPTREKHIARDTVWSDEHFSYYE